MKTITASMPAWLPGHAASTLLDAEPTRVINNLAFSEHDMKGAGWTHVGHAEIVVQMIDDEVLVRSQVDSLERKRSAVLAEAQRQCNAIDDMISKLSALTYEAAPEEIK